MQRRFAIGEIVAFGGYNSLTRTYLPNDDPAWQAARIVAFTDHGGYEICLFNRRDQRAQTVFCVNEDLRRVQ
jgi:hypothetical protein